MSVRRVEDITGALRGSRVSSSTISALNKKSYENIEKWQNLPITEEFPYVYLDGISLKRSWSGEVRNVSVLVAVGVSHSGYRDVLGVAEGCKEDKEVGELPALPEDTGAQRGEAFHHGQMPWSGRVAFGVLPGCAVAEVRGSFLPEHPEQGSEGQDEGGCFNAQGHICPGG